MTKSVLFAAVISVCCPLFSATTNDWINSSFDNTPWTAHDIFTPSNWKSGTTPSGIDAFLYFQNATSIANIQYINVSSKMGLVYLYNRNQNVFIGDKLFFESENSDFRPGAGVGSHSYPPYIYCDFELGALAKDPWFNGLNFAGNVILTNATRDLVFSSGTAHFREYLFAENSNEKRNGMIKDGSVRRVSTGSANFNMYAPKGCDEHEIVCTQTEGSQYLIVDKCSGVLAAGTIVTGEGIPEGTFLKRVFPEEKYIELSAAVTSSVVSNNVTLAAFTPDYKQYINHFYRQGDSVLYRISLVKYREEDSAVLEIGKLTSANVKTFTMFGTMDANEMQGVIQLHDVSSSSQRGAIGFYNSRIMLDETGSTAKPGFTGNYPCFIDGDYAVEFIVTNNINAEISRMTNFVGTVIKSGDGALKIVLDANAPSGIAVVKEGELTFTRHENLVSREEIDIKKIEIGSDGELIVDNFTLNVGTLTLEDGAKISGTGTVNVVSFSSDINFEHFDIASTITLKMATPGESGNIILGDSTPGVSVHPAFWVDASKPESIVYTTENGTNFVTRWNDWREGETMFCTNLNAVNRPQFINGELMTNKYVRIGAQTNITDLSLSEHLVWNVPIYDVRAVFLVQDPSEGGGELLGRCSWRLGDRYYKSRGGPYYRGDSLNFNQQIYQLSTSYATPSVLYGRCFIDNVEVSSNPKYQGRFMQVIDHHVNTNYSASASIGPLAADCFGAGYANAKDNNYRYIKYCNGGMRIAECIVFTNSLTYAERIAVRQYLMSKWLNKTIAYHYYDETVESPSIALNEDSNLQIDVASGTNVVNSVTGSGLLVKTGEGTVFVDSIDGARLDVRQGDAIINTLITDIDDLVPTMLRRTGFEPWLHVDASKSTTLHTSEDSDGTIDVTQWDDVRGNGVRLEMAYADSKKFPVLEQNVVNSLPMVDFGERVETPSTSNNPLLIYVKPDGSRYERLGGGIDSPTMKTSFFVANSANGGGSLLGSDQGGYPYLGFPNHQLGEPIISTSMTPNYSSVTNTWIREYKAGCWTFRLNGSDFNPFETPFSLGSDLFLFATINNGYGRRGITFGGVWGYNKSVGGLKYGEILLYDNCLNPIDYDYIEAYLQKKWFNRKTAGEAVAAVSGLSIASGSTVSLFSGSDISTDGLSGGGVLIAENVIANDGAVFTANIKSDGTVETLTIEGKLNLPQNCTVKVTGDLNKDTEGVFTLVTANAIVGADIEWTVDAPEKPMRKYTVTTTDTSILLSVNKVATLLFLK